MDPKIVVWVLRVRERVEVRVGGNIGRISDSDSPGAGCVAAQVVDQRDPVERAGRPQAVGQSASRLWLPVKMAFIDFRFRRLGLILSPSLAALHLPFWPPQAPYLMCCKTL